MPTSFRDIIQVPLGLMWPHFFRSV
jgi:hypothetical protein